jgi:hypothetical protein
MKFRQLISLAIQNVRLHYRKGSHSNAHFTIGLKVTAPIYSISCTFGLHPNVSTILCRATTTSLRTVSTMLPSTVPGILLSASEHCSFQSPHVKTEKLDRQPISHNLHKNHVREPLSLDNMWPCQCFIICEIFGALPND